MQTRVGRIAGAFPGRAAGTLGWQRRSGDDGDRVSGVALACGRGFHQHYCGVSETLYRT